MKYTTPPLPKNGDPDSGELSDWRRRLMVPVSKEMVQSVEIGQKLTMTLSGEVVGTRAEEGEGNDPKEKRHKTMTIEIRVANVEIPDDMAEFEKGYSDSGGGM